MASKKICILSDHHICVNPRVWKEAFVYEKMGYNVIILTKWLNEEHKQLDFEILSDHNIRYKYFLNLIPGHLSNVKRFYYRLRKRIASELQRYFKAGGSWAINHAPDLLFKKALEENADFYSAHLETSLYAGVKLIKAGKKVSFDFEDWYSRDYLTPDRAVILLQKLERFALNYASFCTAASESMARALQNTYQSKDKPSVVYNSFPDQELGGASGTSDAIGNRFKIVWTSRTVGPNRGIETFLIAASLISEPFDFHLIGDCALSYRQFIVNEFPKAKGHQLFFHSFIKHNDLLPMLSSFDLGLAMEEYLSESRNTTVTNKILQYLQAGIRVLATNTLGQKEIAVHFPQSVKTVKVNDPEDWAKNIELMIRTRSMFDNKVQYDIYESLFAWEKQENKIMKLIKESL
jgi:glycosyltransferase involved in cell wall biosynthesis